MRKNIDLKSSSVWVWHLAAIFSVTIWGLTFISTKVLLVHLTPVQILLYRSVMAYVALFIMSPKITAPKSLRNEMLYLGAGLCGISLYFIFENNALQWTYASNAALIVTGAPLISALLAPLVFSGERLLVKTIIGSLVSFTGVAMIITNGSVVLELNPLGDFLALLAAIVWAFFAILLSTIDTGRISLIAKMRKIFFYGIVTTLLYVLFTKEPIWASCSFNMPVIANIVFLGLIASALCYVLWNQTIIQIGVVNSMMYMYLVPVVSIIFGALLLHEKITLLTLLGGACVIGGLLINQNLKSSTEVSHLFSKVGSCFLSTKG